jgi:hypothetical protein
MKRKYFALADLGKGLQAKYLGEFASFDDASAVGDKLDCCFWILPAADLRFLSKTIAASLKRYSSK